MVMVIIFLHRVYLSFLKKPDDAVRIVKEYNSISGAKMVARYAKYNVQNNKTLKNIFLLKNRFFEKLNDISSALNFLVISKCQEEAYSIAQVIYLCLID